MKNKVFSFFILVFLILSIVPAINFYSGVKKLKIKYIYNVDFIIPMINRFLYSYGVNVKPGQVIVGKQGWLYLGDDYAETVTLARQGINSSYIEKAVAKREELDSWNAFLKSKGVKDFKILIGPNKSSVYPEFLPSWFELSKNKKIEALIDITNNNYYISSESALFSAKEISPEHDLYYKTDTHWNRLGAWIAFDYFIREIKDKNPEINYNQKISIKSIVEKNNGDLSGFLRLPGEIKDQDHIVEILPYSEIVTDCQIFYTNEKVECSNNPEIISQPEPLLVSSVGSLNNKKVLWIRDSFGTAVSPYMARTFSNVIQVHYDNLDKEKLINIVEDFSPDYVFMTIVERSIDGGLPVSYPEVDSYKSIVHSYPAELIGSNDLEIKDNSFYISGDDPFLIYKLASEVSVGFNDTIAISLTCAGNRQENVNIQLFWKKDERYSFSEENSARYSISQGNSYVKPSWSVEGTVKYFRLDIESSLTNKCMKFNINNLIFNKRA